MENLPKEILIQVFANLDGHSLFHAAKVCQLWSEIINNSIEITSKFSYKVHTGVNFMPDFMDYKMLRHFQFNTKHSKDSENIKIARFWPNVRTTEVCDIIDETGEKFDELMDIFNDNGRLWRKVNFHDVKLQKIQDFSSVFESLVNCQELNLNRCSVEVTEYNDDDDLEGYENNKLEKLEVTMVEWSVWKALKVFKKIKSLNVSSSKPPSTADFHEFLAASNQLSTLSLFGSSKLAFISSFPYNFQLEKLVIDRTNAFHNQYSENYLKLSDLWEFLVNQKKSLKKLKFKGIITENMIAKISNELNLKSLNLHFWENEKESPKNLGMLKKNVNLEKLHCVGNLKDLKMLMKYFPNVKSLKLNGSSFTSSTDLIPSILFNFPQLTVLKIFQPVSIPNSIDTTLVQLDKLKILKITVTSSEEVTKVLQMCPNLTKLTLLTEFSGNFDDLVINSSIEELCLVNQNFINNFEVINNILRLLQCLPGLKKFSLNSQMMGRIVTEPRLLPSIETAKLDFTCTTDQCNNMFELIKCFSNVKSLEIISKFIGNFQCPEGFQFNHLKSLSVLGIDEDFIAFENLMEFVKVSPILEKIDFWIRGCGSDGYCYHHNEKVKTMEVNESLSMRDLKLTKFESSELEMLLYLLKCFVNLKKLSIGVGEDDLNDNNLTVILDQCENLEELSLDKNFKWTAENLTIIKTKLKNLKKFEIFDKKPLEMRQILRNVFGNSHGIEFIINQNCLEEWKNDEIVRI